MRFDLKKKISKRIHPWPLILYDLRRSWRGFRTYLTAAQHGEPIDCHGADHIHIYMTLRCPMGCDHCINHRLLNMNTAAFNQYARSWQEKPWQEWRDFLNRLCWIRELYFNGGEHFIVEGFGDLINSLDKFNINIFSNLSILGQGELVKLQKGNNNIIIKSSYHPLNDDPINLYMERVSFIPKGILWNPHLIRWPGVSVKMYQEKFARCGITATSDDDVYDTNQQKRPPRRVLCRTNEHNIGPDMKMYRCLLHMLRGMRGENIDTYSFSHEWIECNYFPWCHTHTAYNEIKYLD